MSDPQFNFDHAPCGLISTRADGTIVSVNDTFCSWMGRSREQLAGGLRVQDLLTTGCKIFHQTHWLPLLQMQGSVAEVQLDFVHDDGQQVPALVNAIQRKVDASVRHEIAVFVAADRRKYERELLLARRRAEELLESVRSTQEQLALAQTRLQLAVDAAGFLVWDVEVVSGIPRYADGVQGLLGLPLSVSVGAEDFHDRMHPEDRPHEARKLAQALSPDGDGRYSSEYRLLGHDGVERVVRSSGAALRHERGTLLAFAGVLQDVTKWRRAEEALRQQEQHAQQRASFSEQLIGIVSHDLRSPLQTVAMGAGLLASQQLTATQMRAVTRVQAATHRAGRLITDLLDFTQARLGSGLRVTRTNNDLHELVHDAIEEIRLAWPGRMLAQVRQGKGEVQIDSGRIQQLLTNLLANALTYGTAERPVTVTSFVGSSTCALRVHNHGPPIPEDLRAELFQPMRRGAQQVELGSRSVGLGLYIVEQIAVAHQGSVRVESNEPDGTTFVVTLPVDGKPGDSPGAK